MPTKKKTIEPVAYCYHKARKKYGISRIDTPHNSTHGFYVRIRPLNVEMFFSDGVYKGKRRAQEAAELFRDQQCMYLTEAQQLRASKPRKPTKKKAIVKGGK